MKGRLVLLLLACACTKSSSNEGEVRLFDPNGALLVRESKGAIFDGHGKAVAHLDHRVLDIDGIRTDLGSVVTHADESSVDLGLPIGAVHVELHGTDELEIDGRRFGRLEKPRGLGFESPELQALMVVIPFLAPSDGSDARAPEHATEPPETGSSTAAPPPPPPMPPEAARH